MTHSSLVRYLSENTEISVKILGSDICQVTDVAN